MDDKISPEEKLLRLIRKENPILSKRYSKAGGLLLRRLLGFSKTFKGFVVRLGLFKITLFFFIVSLVSLFVSFIYSPFTLNRRIGKRSYAEIKIPTILGEEEGKPLEFYLQEVAKNDIFNITPPEQKEKGTPFDAFRDIALLGIISEEPPQAIIKDKKSDNTYFLKKGDTLGEFILLDISEGKVIIEYRGERFEIYL